MRYGIPYLGSKNSIAREIVRFLPGADTRVDICAGGAAITHAALELCEGFAPKWRHIISNDVNPHARQAVPRRDSREIRE